MGQQGRLRGRAHRPAQQVTVSSVIMAWHGKAPQQDPALRE